MLSIFAKHNLCKIFHKSFQNFCCYCCLWFWLKNSSRIYYKLKKFVRKQFFVLINILSALITEDCVSIDLSLFHIFLTLIYFICFDFLLLRHIFSDSNSIFSNFILHNTRTDVQCTTCVQRPCLGHLKFWPLLKSGSTSLWSISKLDFSIFFNTIFWLIRMNFEFEKSRRFVTWSSNLQVCEEKLKSLTLTFIM